MPKQKASKNLQILLQARSANIWIYNIKIAPNLIIITSRSSVEVCLPDFETHVSGSTLTEAQRYRQEGHPELSVTALQ